jgi:hypothetical protein
MDLYSRESKGYEEISDFRTLKSERAGVNPALFVCPPDRTRINRSRAGHLPKIWANNPEKVKGCEAHIYQQGWPGSRGLFRNSHKCAILDYSPCWLGYPLFKTAPRQGRGI